MVLPTMGWTLLHHLIFKTVLLEKDTQPQFSSLLMAV